MRASGDGRRRSTALQGWIPLWGGEGANELDDANHSCIVHKFVQCQARIHRELCTWCQGGCGKKVTPQRTVFFSVSRTREMTRSATGPA
jgi:hypothetical protein